MRIFNLDGVVDSKDSETRERDRTEFKETIMAELVRLSGVCSEDMTSLQEFPNDFWILMSQVDGIVGHGWPEYPKEGQQVTLRYGLDYSRILVEPDKLELYDWEVLADWIPVVAMETVNLAHHDPKADRKLYVRDSIIIAQSLLQTGHDTLLERDSVPLPLLTSFLFVNSVEVVGADKLWPLLENISWRLDAITRIQTQIISFLHTKLLIDEPHRSSIQPLWCM